MSHIGLQLEVPRGFAQLRKGRTYYFLGRHRDGDMVTLAFYDANQGAHLETISSREFEAGLNKRFIVQRKEQAKLPPYLSALEGLDLSDIDKALPPSRRERRKKSSSSIAQRRVDAIRPMLKHVQAILGANDPRVAVGHFARKHRPKQNEKRLFTWLITYLIFGKRTSALLPAYRGRVGTWSRDGRKNLQKPGRNPVTGRQSGYPRTPDMIDKIRQGWKKFHGLGVFMTVIVERTLTEVFGCRVRVVDKRGTKEFYHPKGAPFPTEWQIRYELLKFLGRATIQKILHGEVRTRTKLRGSLGAFSSIAANLLGRMNGDAYTLREVPRGPLDGEPMPPLLVIRLRCLLSGMIVGIGFSIGGERAEAYRMALFSMALPKAEFCALFGEIIDAEEWPCLGIPSWATFDRGAGSTTDYFEEIADRIPITEMTMSWQGQSNAPIEASHPKKHRAQGKPTYRLSKHNYVDLARREIRRTIKDNQAINMKKHMTPEMVKARVHPTPLGLWKYFESRMRTDAHMVDPAQAVRELLRKVTFSMHEDGLYLHGQLFDSTELRRTGLHDRVIRTGAVPCEGFVFELAVRHAWVDVKGQLIKVDARLPHIDGEKQLYMSLPELEQIGLGRKRLDSEHRRHRRAVGAEARQAYKQGTGKEWDAGTTRSGRAKRGTPRGRQASRDVTGALGRGGRGARA